MSDLNEEAIRMLGKLCRIEVQDEDIPSLLQDLKGILTYIDLLQEVDVSDLPPYSHFEAAEEFNLREDKVTSTLTREAFLSNAPEHVGGMIKVPTVIKQTP